MHLDLKVVLGEVDDLGERLAAGSGDLEGVLVLAGADDGQAVRTGAGKLGLARALDRLELATGAALGLARLVVDDADLEVALRWDACHEAELVRGALVGRVHAFGDEARLPAMQLGVHGRNSSELVPPQGLARRLGLMELALGDNLLVSVDDLDLLATQGAAARAAHADAHLDGLANPHGRGDAPRGDGDMVGLDGELEEHVALLVRVLERGAAVLGHREHARLVVHDVLVLAGLGGHGERNRLAHGKLAFLRDELHVGDVLTQDGGEVQLVAHQVAAALASAEDHERARVADIELLRHAVDVEEHLVALAIELGGYLFFLQALDVDLGLLAVCHIQLLLESRMRGLVNQCLQGYPKTAGMMPPERISSRAFSSKTGTPSSRARVSLEPAASPATT